jgi:hypothetical protein
MCCERLKSKWCQYIWKRLMNLSILDKDKWQYEVFFTGLKGNQPHKESFIGFKLRFFLDFKRTFLFNSIELKFKSIKFSKIHRVKQFRKIQVYFSIFNLLHEYQSAHQIFIELFTFTLSIRLSIFCITSELQALNWASRKHE